MLSGLPPSRDHWGGRGGKTTLLAELTVRMSRETNRIDRLPVFAAPDEWRHWRSLSDVIQYLATWGGRPTTTPEELEARLHGGGHNFLFMLDGVKGKDASQAEKLLTRIDLLTSFPMLTTSSHYWLSTARLPFPMMEVRVLPLSPEQVMAFAEVIGMPRRKWIRSFFQKEGAELRTPRVMMKLKRITASWPPGNVPSQRTRTILRALLPIPDVQPP